MPPDQRLATLEVLYAEIHETAVARDRGSTPLHPRPVVPRVLESNLLLLAQGLAESTQRVTGYPYRRPDGLSPVGLRLDAFLRPLEHTIDHLNTARRYAYSTDLVPWFSGKTADGRHDIAPTDVEIDECWRWIEREIKIIKPRAIVLLGRPAARSFLRRYTAIKVGRSKPSLSDLSGRAFSAQVGDDPVTAVVAWHPSSAWGAFVDRARVSYEAAQDVLHPVLSR